ncbi:uncharacterized protein K489DRAFT_242851 [Dissoconium aciculare CBS 342.82]|uniref:Uncharacterized protein n=1 Tax=Dissoconium aciculare CBS 342.82 TaxID=1314786 RepID=A0A6J3M3F7_9PEZI|nr:uncharacterized protein K489DRAFT_242851 [Dissoconium aciculare CBS 342.82]KAF1822433.1 hypothetical protein K489DRAFT_242851 [Dissoconium aciculare CBS 342.82]
MTILLPRRPPSATVVEGTAVEDTAMVSIIPSMPPPPSSSQSVPGLGPLPGEASSNSIPGEFQPRSHFTGREVLFVVPRRPGIRGPVSFVCDKGVMAWCSSIFDAEITRACQRRDEAVVVARGRLSGRFPRVVLGRVDDPGLFALFHRFIHTGSFSGMLSSSKALRMKQNKGQGEITIPRCKGSSIYGRQSQKDTLSSLPSESTNEKQKTLTPTTNLHPPTNPTTTTTTAPTTNPASSPSPSTDQNPLSYTTIFTLWIFADHHDIPMLQNRLMDQLLAQICTSHTLPTAEEMTPVFLQGFPGISLLGEFLCALAIELAHRHHHLHRHRSREEVRRPGGDRDKLTAAAAAEMEEDASSCALARLDDVLYGSRGIPCSGAAIDPIEDSIAGIFRRAEHLLLLQLPLPHDAHAATADEEEKLRPRGDHLAAALRGGEQFHLPSGEFLRRARRCEWHVHAEGVSCRASR